MTLPVSGPMQTSMINVELALPATQLITLNDTRVRGLAAKPAGIIALNDFYGKSDRLVNTVTLSTNSLNYTFNPAKITGYVSGKTDATLVINSGVYVYTTAVATAALIVSGWAAGDTVTIINNGYIMGQGGAGGGGSAVNSAGSAGGLAISLSFSVAIVNNSYIGGGGGGGGGKNDSGIIVGAGGGAGGGNGGAGGAGAGGVGGGLGQSGANGIAAGYLGDAVGNPPNVHGTGGGGGRVFPGVGGLGGISQSNGSPATASVIYECKGKGGTAGGGGATGYNNGPRGSGGAGGSAGNAAVTVTSIAGAGGGGGWGAAGGAAGLSGGIGGKAIQLNGFTATRSGTGTIYGAVS